MQYLIYAITVWFCVQAVIATVQSKYSELGKVYVFTVCNLWVAASLIVATLS